MTSRASNWRTQSVDAARAYRERYNDLRQMAIKHWCPLCNEPIERFHRYKLTEQGREHRNCRIPTAKA